MKDTEHCRHYVVPSSGQILCEIFDGRRIPQELELIIVPHDAEPETAALTHSDATCGCSSWTATTKTFGNLQLCTDDEDGTPAWYLYPPDDFDAGAPLTIHGDERKLNLMGELAIGGKTAAVEVSPLIKPRTCKTGKCGTGGKR